MTQPSNQPKHNPNFTSALQKALKIFGIVSREGIIPVMALIGVFYLGGKPAYIIVGGLVLYYLFRGNVDVPQLKGLLQTFVDMLTKK